jgi:hypothetical protein
MAIGHFIAIIGGLLAVIGTTLFPWEHFQLAQITTVGYRIPSVQIALGLGGLTVLVSLVALLAKRRRPFALPVLALGGGTLAAVLHSNTTRLATFELMPYEVVDLAQGYTMAFWGAVTVLFGALMVAAVVPAWNPRARFLRVGSMWGTKVVKEQLVDEPMSLTLGSGPKNDFVIPSADVPASMTIVRADSRSAYSLGLSPQLKGEVVVQGAQYSVSDYAKRGTPGRGGQTFVPIPQDSNGQLRFGDYSLYFQFVRPDRRLLFGGVLMDLGLIAALGVSFYLQVGGLLAGIFLWDVNAVRELQENEKKVLKAELVAVDPNKEEELPEEEKDDSSKRAAGEEGKFGDPDKIEESKVPKREGELVEKINPEDIGLNKLLRQNLSSAITDIMAQNSQLSSQLAVAMAGEGSEFVIGHGSGGLSFTSGGTGGGGTGGYGAIHGLGNLDTGGTGVKAGLGDKGTRRVGKMSLEGGTSKGGCDKGNIASVVKRRAGAIRACYEARLQVNPKLAGKFTARWTIDADGKVTSADGSGSMADGEVNNCILRTIRRMQFLKPEGGVCVVQWPFVFSGGG